MWKGLTPTTLMLAATSCSWELFVPELDAFPEPNACNTVRYLTGEWPSDHLVDGETAGFYKLDCDEHDRETQRCIFVVCMEASDTESCGDVASGFVDYHLVMDFLFAGALYLDDPEPEHTCWRYAARNSEVEQCLDEDAQGRAHLSIWCERSTEGSR